MSNVYRARLKNILVLLKRTSFSVSKARRILALSKRPVIIGGCGRSGTTLLINVLSCHPRIVAIKRETGALCPGRWRKSKDQAYAEEKVYPRLDSIYTSLLARDIPASCTRWCEKSPANIRAVDSILEYFGSGARFIHIVRDGRAVCTSVNPKRPDEFYASPDRWVRDVSAGLAYEDHPQVLTLRYEDLVLHFEDTLRRVCSFIEEDFPEHMLTYPDCVKVTKQDDWWFESVRPISSASIDRWKQAAYRETIEEFMAFPGFAELLERCGYLEEALI